jgi:hypothetical protein
MERVHRPSAAFVQVRLHLPTLAGLEELPQPGVSKADDHSVERKADATECQLSIYTPGQRPTHRDVPGERTALQSARQGFTAVFTKTGNDILSARVLTMTAIYSGVGLTDEGLNTQLGQAMMRTPFPRCSSLRIKWDF